MAAQAQEYHESMAIEKAIKEDPIKREAWIKKQLLFDPARMLDDKEIAGIDEEAPSKSLESAL